MKVEVGHGAMLANGLLDLAGGSEMGHEGVGESDLAFLLGRKEVDGMDVAVGVDEVLKVSNEGRQRGLGRTSDGDFERERLLTSFLPENCVE